jgi:hypothetical protein
MSLALLALTLPTAALANSTDIDFTIGTFKSGTVMGSFTSGATTQVTVVGSLATISITTGTLTLETSVCPGTTCFAWTGGSVTVEQGGMVVFHEDLTRGLVAQDDDQVSINAHFKTPIPGLVTLSLDEVNKEGSGTLFADATRVPEPGTLLSFGTGVIGLAVMIRRMLKRGT